VAASNIQGTVAAVYKVLWQQYTRYCGSSIQGTVAAVYCGSSIKVHTNQARATEICITHERMV